MIIDQDNSDYPSRTNTNNVVALLFEYLKITGMATTLRGINSRNCFIAKFQDLIRIKSSNVYSSIRCPSVQT